MNFRFVLILHIEVKKGMNSRLMELIDVSTIETMAEQFYKLTNISHQLLDAEKRVCFFHSE